LTEEGRKVLGEWMVKYPHPIQLLVAAWPALFSRAIDAKLTEEEIDSACWEGIARTFVRFNPERASLKTAAAWGVRGAVCDAIRAVEYRKKEYGFSHRWCVHTNKQGDTWSSDEPEMPVEESDLDKREYVQALIDLADLSEREEEVLRLRFWSGWSLQEIATGYSISKERVRQVEAAALEKLEVAADAKSADDEKRLAAIRDLCPRVERLLMVQCRSLRSLRTILSVSNLHIHWALRDMEAKGVICRERKKFKKGERIFYHLKSKEPQESGLVA
jgi:RNA polymerase sigma factor (sigma-70 family)